MRFNNEIIIAIFKAYTRNLSTYANIETLYKDTISHLSKNISINTFKLYLTVLKEMYIIDEIKS
ncbi:hypothetical protein FACS189459_1300 [Bacilli bacterium]|nr:hypothetical protein FACS189459_1300 [Bacilli bacterium]